MFITIKKLNTPFLILLVLIQYVDVLYDPSKKTQKSLDSVMNLTSTNGKKSLIYFNI